VHGAELGIARADKALGSIKTEGFSFFGDRLGIDSFAWENIIGSTNVEL
jgi:hypothetical protein